MNSVAVQFRISIASDSRRQLQAAIDTTSAAFSAQLTAALVDALPTGITEANLLLDSTDATGGEFSVTIVGLDALPQLNVATIVTRVDEPTFLESLGASLGARVALETPAAIVVRSTPKPSPPPNTSSSPSSPMMPRSYEEALSHEQPSAQAFGSTLTEEMLWVIILAVISVVVCLGCFTAFYCGVRHNVKKQRAARIVEVSDRPTAPNRSPPTGEANLESASTASPQHLNNYFIELGMSLERQRSHSAAGETSPGGLHLTSAASVAAAAATAAATNVMTPTGRASSSQDNGVQAALAIINEVRGLAESLSPRSAGVSSGAVRIQPARLRNLEKSFSLPDPRLSNEGDFDARI